MATTTSTLQLAPPPHDRVAKIKKAFEAIGDELCNDMRSFSTALCGRMDGLSGKLDHLSDNIRSNSDELHKSTTELLSNIEAFVKESHANHIEFLAEYRRLKTAAMEEERADAQALHKNIHEGFISIAPLSRTARRLDDAHPDDGHSDDAHPNAGRPDRAHPGRALDHRARSNPAPSARAYASPGHHSNKRARSAVTKSRKPIPRKRRQAAARLSLHW
ncbi:hypothetical protein SLS58_002941 [Diplodia intermedia]|uniref:Uncharacterized protein n=1 Tax=Diplodia intermedia TaxID=856260 RepID=A0ABR3TY12_9PEZI